MKRLRPAAIPLLLLAVGGCASRFPPYPPTWSQLQTSEKSCQIFAGRYLNKTETNDIFGPEEVRQEAALWGLLVGYRSKLSHSQTVEIRTANPAAVEIIAWSEGPVVEELGRVKIALGESGVACDKGIWTIKANPTPDVMLLLWGQDIGDLRIEKAIDGSLIVKEQLNGLMFHAGGVFGNSPQPFIWGHRWLRFRAAPPSTATAAPGLLSSGGRARRQRLRSARAARGTRSPSRRCRNRQRSLCSPRERWFSCHGVRTD